MKMKMWSLTIRIKKNDELGGKLLQTLLIDLLKKSDVAGATVWTELMGLANGANPLCILKAFP
jgi:PII-like signaling protein